MWNQRSARIRKLSALPCENPQQIIFVEAALRGFPIWKVWQMQGSPVPPGLLESSS
jgi:hypothetical protein